MSSFISNTGRKLEEAHGDDPRPASRLLLRLLQQEFCPKLHTQGAHRGKAHPQLLPHLVPILAKTLFITYCCPIEQKARLYLSKVCFVINDFQLLVKGKAHSCTHLRKSLQNGSSCPIEQKARLFLSNVFIIRDLQLLVNDKALT